MANDLMAFPRISFGIIVLNGEPFTKYCLRQLYPHAYEIIVVEGGSEKAIAVAPNGHSVDGTLLALWEFKEKEDIDNKVQIITKEGFWLEKDEQSRSYAEKASGDYLWQVDIDEFYRHADIEMVRQKLAVDPTIDTISFKQYAFWGSPWIIADSFGQRSDRYDQYHRLFKWQKDYSYKTHRPPTVLDENGIDLRKKHWVKAEEIAKESIFLYHYSLLFPEQVINKCMYYATPSNVTRLGYAPQILDWAENSYFSLRRPFRVHNYDRNISWLKRFNFQRPQPEESINMWNDVLSGLVDVELRDNRDAERLLRDPIYISIALFLSAFAELLKWYPLSIMRKMYMVIFDRYKNLKKK